MSIFFSPLREYYITLIGVCIASAESERSTNKKFLLYILEVVCCIAIIVDHWRSGTTNPAPYFLLSAITLATVIRIISVSFFLQKRKCIGKIILVDQERIRVTIIDLIFLFKFNFFIK